MFGFFNIYKPKGKTSHDVVAILRRVTKIKQIGHTGTLDPFAEGVLPVCIGKATRLIEYLADDKAYIGTVQLGKSTTTYDIEGDMVKVSDKEVSIEEIEKALQSFRGEVEQFLIVRRQDPRREIADFSDQLLQFFEIDPFSGCVIRSGKHCQSTGILIVNVLIAGPVSRFPEIQIQFRKREREILKQKPVRAGDGRLHGWRIDQRLFLSGRKIFSGNPR